MMITLERSEPLTHDTNIEDAQFGGSLSAEQKSFYDREGYLIVPNLLSYEELAPARAAMTEKVDQIAAEMLENGLITDVLSEEPFETRLAKLFENHSDKEFLKYGRSWRDRIGGYFVLMSNPKILDVIESLIGPEIFSNPVYNVRPKVPKVAAGQVPWHQDKSYWPDANSNPVITTWIPLVDSTLENGCLHLIPRTHRRRVVEHGADTYTGTAYTEIAEKFITGRKKDIIALPMTAGSAIFFNDRLMHSSTANNSQGVRWSVDLRYQPTNQDPMPQYGAGFLARSHRYPERVATLEDWLNDRPEHIDD